MKLAVVPRDVLGKKVKNLRKQGIIPAIIYGKHLPESLSVCVEKLPLLKAYAHTGSSTPLEVVGDTINQLVLFHHIQLDPVTDRVLHVEFLAVQKDEKVTTDVPLVLVGVSPFEKTGAGRIQLVVQTVQVTAFPLDLPHNIQIDISHIEHEGQVMYVKDLPINDKVHIDEDLEAPVVTALVYEVAKEDEEVQPTEEAEPSTPTQESVS